jgi:hypothetical protein
MTADFQTNGTYQSVGEFLSDLRNIDDVVIDINQLLISSDLADNSQIKVHINLAFYFSKQNET